jgi:hypothetical protein
MGDRGSLEPPQMAVQTSNTVGRCGWIPQRSNASTASWTDRIRNTPPVRGPKNPPVPRSTVVDAWFLRDVLWKPYLSCCLIVCPGTSDGFGYMAYYRNGAEQIGHPGLGHCVLPKPHDVCSPLLSKIVTPTVSGHLVYAIGSYAWPITPVHRFPPWNQEHQLHLEPTAR